MEEEEVTSTPQSIPEFIEDIPFDGTLSYHESLDKPDTLKLNNTANYDLSGTTSVRPSKMGEGRNGSSNVVARFEEDSLKLNMNREKTMRLEQLMILVTGMVDKLDAMIPPVSNDSGQQPPSTNNHVSFTLYPSDNKRDIVLKACDSGDSDHDDYLKLIKDTPLIHPDEGRNDWVAQLVFSPV